MPIYDQGYQHWHGPLAGHAWTWRTIARHGLRIQLKNPIVQLLMIAAWLPALGLVAAAGVWGLLEQKNEAVLMLLRWLPAAILNEPQAYRATIWTLAYSYFFKTETFSIMLLAVAAGPGLISRDLRFNALPLYLARPLTRLDYFLGKLGVIGGLVALAVIGPAVFAYVVGLCFSFDLSVVRDTYPVLLASIAYGLVLTLSVGTFVLALSSLTRQSLYVGVACAGIWVVSGTVTSIMVEIHEHSVREELREQYMKTWLEENPPPPGVQVQIHRYGYSIGAISGEEAHVWYAGFQMAQGTSWRAPGLAAAMRDDWRPLCSYANNLVRMSELLLRTDAAWADLGRAFKERGLADEKVMHYPWEWSAGILAAFLGLSAWILSRRDKIAGPAEVTPVIEFDGVSKWYGNVIGLNKLTLSLAAGVTGLLGPNGAGKSTLLQLATGQIRPSQGSVRVLGHTAWNNPALMRHIGLCPEQDAFYEWMTGFDFVRTCARLSGLGGRAASEAAENALTTAGMRGNMHRAIRGYSKGMRQRTKLAQAMVHEPSVLFLDEPFTGTDPVGRHEMIEVIRQVGAAGRTVVVSSHVLHEVQALTPNIVLLHQGRLVAEGHVRQIRDLMDAHPHRIVLVCDNYRGLAARALAWDDVEGVKVMSDQSAILVETRKPDAFYERLPALAVEEGTGIREVYSEDDNLEAVFKYLVSR